MSRDHSQEIKAVDIRNHRAEGVMDISLPMLLKTYANLGIWDDVLFEMVCHLQEEFNTYYRMYDEKEAQNFYTYPESTGILENGILSFATRFSKQLFFDLLASVWSYDGVLKIFCCTGNQTLTTFASDYLFTIAPFNDGESIEICYASDQIVTHLIQVTTNVLQSYGLSINYQNT